MGRCPGPPPAHTLSVFLEEREPSLCSAGTEAMSQVTSMSPLLCADRAWDSSASSAERRGELSRAAVTVPGPSLRSHWWESPGSGAPLGSGLWTVWLAASAPPGLRGQAHRGQQRPCVVWLS